MILLLLHWMLAAFFGLNISGMRYFVYLSYGVCVIFTLYVLGVIICRDVYLWSGCCVCSVQTRFLLIESRD